MADEAEFAEFLRRLRAGDQDAAVQLIRRFESAIRIQVRLRLTDSRLCRVLDSLDICQSVLASFFVRAAAGEYDLNHPDQLYRLLVAMALNKLSYARRRERTQRRGGALQFEADPTRLEATAAGVEPSRHAAGRELLAEVRRRLTDEERQVADLRAQGRNWAEVAAELGGTAEARRKQLARGLDRVSQELGLDEP